MAVTTNSRIPPSLQAVFLASNQGHNVHEPPNDGSAFKVFRRNGLRSNRSGSFMRHPFFEGIRSMFGKTSPQALFHRKLKERGYYPKHYKSKLSGYFNQPTKHQLASFGSKLLDIVKRNQTLEFRAMLEAGLSPNACNTHGESLLHMVCRHGQVRLFRILIEFYVDPRQTDDMGRTPLHEACLASVPSFEMVRWLIRSDPGLLFLIDNRGSLPLDYVNKCLWPQWNQFIQDSIDDFFPKSSSAMDITPGLCGVPPNSRPVATPWNAISPFWASKIASGEMAPHEIHMVSPNCVGIKQLQLQQQQQQDEDETIQHSMPSESYYDDGDDDGDDDDDESTYSSASDYSCDSEDDDDDNYPSLYDDSSEFAFQRGLSPFGTVTIIPVDQHEGETRLPGLFRSYGPSNKSMAR